MSELPESRSAAGALVERIDAPEAARRARDEGWILVDVRTEAEYAAGHPTGALNVPWQLTLAASSEANPAFVDVLASVAHVDAPLLLLCKSGVRSLRAAEALVRLGRARVADVRPGMDGLRDAFGRVREKGWIACGLPVERGTAEGDYASLLARRAR